MPTYDTPKYVTGALIVGASTLYMSRQYTVGIGGGKKMLVAVDNVVCTGGKRQDIYQYVVHIGEVANISSIWGEVWCTTR